MAIGNQMECNRCEKATEHKVKRITVQAFGAFVIVTVECTECDRRTTLKYVRDYSVEE